MYMPNANLTLCMLGLGVGTLGVTLGMLRVGVGTLGVTLGMLRVGVGPQGFLDTNMLVSPTRIFCLGGLDQREAPTQSGSPCGEIKAL